MEIANRKKPFYHLTNLKGGINPSVDLAVNADHLRSISQSSIWV